MRIMKNVFLLFILLNITFSSCFADQYKWLPFPVCQNALEKLPQGSILVVYCSACDDAYAEVWLIEQAIPAIPYENDRFYGGNCVIHVFGKRLYTSKQAFAAGTYQEPVEFIPRDCGQRWVVEAIDLAYVYVPVADNTFQCLGRLLKYECDAVPEIIHLPQDVMQGIEEERTQLIEEIALCESTSVVPQPHWFLTGELGNEESIQIDIQEEGHHDITGEYVSEMTGESLFLRGEKMSPQDLSVNAYQTFEESLDEQGKRVAEFSLTILDERANITRIREEGKQEFSPLALVAQYMLLEKRSEIGAVMTAAFPQFTNRARMNTYLSEIIRPEADDAYEDVVGYKKDIVEEGGANFIEFQTDLWYTLHYYSPEFVSLSRYVYQDVGTAHGNVYRSTENVLIDDEKISSITLNELFTDEKAIEILSQACLDDLRRQEASFVVRGEITEFSEQNFEAFLLTPKGITILFEPYEVASWQEGSFEVTIPLDTLKPFLNSDHPAIKIVFKERIEQRGVWKE